MSKPMEEVAVEAKGITSPPRAAAIIKIPALDFKSLGYSPIDQYDQVLFVTDGERDGWPLYGVQKVSASVWQSLKVCPEVIDLACEILSIDFTPGDNTFGSIKKTLNEVDV